MTEQHVGGMHSVKALLKSAPEKIDRVLVQRGRRDSRLRAVLDLARASSLRIAEVDRKTLDALVADVQHQGVVAVFSGESPLEPMTDLVAVIETRQAQVTRPLLVLVLDEIQDPHNLGACLRSADAVAADAVVIPVDNSVGVTPVVRKVASGAAETISLVQVTNLKRAIGDLQKLGFWVYGAAGEASDTLYELDLSGSVALVLGAEGKGMRRLTRDACDSLFSIPMLGQVESLNVSVAAGISLFEARRQQQ